MPSNEVLEGVTVPQSQPYFCYIIISLDCLRFIEVIKLIDLKMRT